MQGSISEFGFKAILHYALGLRFGKVCDEKGAKREWLAFLPNV